MSECAIKYGFPLFTRNQSTNFIVKTNKLRVSDIWAFWDYMIRKYCSKNNRTTKDKEFLFTLLEQAKYFYITAENAPIKSQSLLYYYSFLNIAKIVINFETFHGKGGEYQHGIRTNVNETTILSNAQIEILQLAGSTKISVANEFAKALGDNYAIYPMALTIKKMLNSCIGIHRAFSETYNKKEYYIRIQNLTIEHSRGLLMSKAIVKDCNVNLMNDLRLVGYNITSVTLDDNSVCYYWEESIPAKTVTRRSYYNLSKHLLNKGIWSYTDGDEYRLYITTSQDAKISSATTIYNIMFFLGSITRYNPYLFDDVMSEKEQWLISEFLKTQPKQFLYMVTSHVLGQEIYKSRALAL